MEEYDSFDSDELLGVKCNFTKNDRARVLIAMASTSLVSVIMCVFTLTLVVVYRLHKHFTYRLASYQVISSMLFSGILVAQICLIKTDYWNNDPLCEVLGFFLEYFMWMKLLFTMALVFHFFILAVYLKNLYRFELLYVLISVLVPFLYVWIPFVRRTYGQAGAWCWIQDWKNDCARANNHIGVIEQFILWYAPLLASLTVSLIAAVYAGIILAKRAYATKPISSEASSLALLHSAIQDQKAHNQAALKQLIPLLAYPIIFYVLVIIPMFNRIYDAKIVRVSLPLAIGHAVSISSWGFFSSCALLIHIAIKRKLRGKRAASFIEYSGDSLNRSTEISGDGYGSTTQ